VKFTGELKFPDIDHPGVPVSFLIEESQAELVVDGESLGRWSLFDIHARRLVASAFQIDLEGTEVTFVADDPIDFAYRGVEHMAGAWAGMKSKRMPTRSVAVRRSRRGTTPSRIEDLKAAMQSNLEGQGPRQIAGEVAMPEVRAASAAEDVEERIGVYESPADWDRRDPAGKIPVVGGQHQAPPAAPSPPEALTPSDEALALERERQELAEERARLDEERRLAEQREVDRIEAFRLEMSRLAAEREELHRQLEEFSPPPAASVQEPEPIPEPVAASEPISEPEPIPEPESVAPPEPKLEPVADLEPEPVADVEPGDAETPTPEVLDLKDLERPAAEPEPVASPPLTKVPVTQPEPAMAGTGKDRSGLMGAVRAAFKTGAREHQHQFIEAPGGLGITRYVCEECGYVSIAG
jgi:hypothetical protein